MQVLQLTQYVYTFFNQIVILIIPISLNYLSYSIIYSDIHPGNCRSTPDRGVLIGIHCVHTSIG